jgi:small GTP-binding protein
MSNNTTEKNPIKIILLGDSGVGKTNIILRYLKNEFNENSLSTIGTTFGVKEMIRNNIKYNLNIWDTTGQEVYRSVTKLFIQGAKIVLLVYCIEQKSTFDSLNFWYDSVKDICEDDIVLAIVANKQDLFDDEEKVQVTEEEGENYAKEKNILYRSVSAKIDKKGIDSLFDTVFDEYLTKISSNKNVENKEKTNVST